MVSMVKFISPKDNTTSFSQGIIEVDEDFSPIKEILKKSDFSQYFFVPSDNDEDKISLGSVFQLQVNVKNVGVFHFIFKSEGFNKEEIVNQISGLKDMNVDNAESARYKVGALVSIVKNYDPLFAVFKESPDTYYYSYQLDLVINNMFPVFVVKPEEEYQMDEFVIGDNIYEESASKPEKKKKSLKISKDKLLKDLLKNKFSLLLIFISTLLLEVSIPLAILNIYAKNALYIFLFICGVIGIVMNTYCYIDYFRNRNVKNPLFLISVASNVLGLGIGIGIFAIFYNISTKAEGTPNIGSLIAIGVLVTIIIVAATIAIIYFIPRKNKVK